MPEDRKLHNLYLKALSAAAGKKPRQKLPQWDIGYVTREGRVPRTSDAVVTLRMSEKDITNTFEDIMKRAEPPFGAYAVFIYPTTGIHLSPAGFESMMDKNKPKFIVYEGGQTTVVT